MPVTPFHFGPAALAKAGAAKYFSLVSFALTQIIIDIEPVFYIWQGMWPIHRFCHTYLGATLVAIVVALCGRPVCREVLRFWNWRLNEQQQSWLGVQTQIPMRAVVIGAFFGAYSHVLLDSVMHSDMHPFAPFSDENGLLFIVSIKLLHGLCALAGALGGVALVVMLIRRKRLAERETRCS